MIRSQYYTVLTNQEVTLSIVQVCPYTFSTDYPIAIGKCEDNVPAGRSSSTASTFSSRNIKGGTESKLNNYIK